jgi:hypothetical protein
MENIRCALAFWKLRIVSNANPSGGIKIADNAAFAGSPQG